MTTAYPLAWPAGRPRTRYPKDGTFSSFGSRITIAQAADRVENEVARLGGSYLLISSNVEVTLSGRPRSGTAAPADPGVCVYFHVKKQPYALACDRYTKVADNLAAIAAHIEAVRKIERHGVASTAETLQAFQALPAPKRPHEILGIPADATEADVKRAWRTRIADAHPDQGGTQAAAAEINAARDAMLKQIGA